MALNVWTGQTTAVVQVGTVQITADDAATTYTLTLTDDNGDTVAVSTTGSGTGVNDTATALQTAWEAETDPRVAEITATVNTDTVTLTADTSGKPFTVAASKSGGTGTIGSYTATTANAGPNDVSVAANWSLNAVPTTGDDVLIPAGAPAILYGLNQSSVAIGDFVRAKGHSNNIGRQEFGFNYHWRIDPDSFKDEGSSSLAMYDIGTAAIAPTINNTGSPTTGKYAVYLKGTAMSAINLLSGVVGVGTELDDTTTECDDFNVIAGTLTIGEGVAATDASGINNIRVSSGSVYNYADVDTVRIENGSYYQEKGNWTTMNGYGGNVYPNSDGTYATTTVKDGCALLNTQDLRAKTFTNTTVEAGATFKDPQKRITFTNAVSHPDGITDSDLDYGTNINFTPASN